MSGTLAKYWQNDEQSMMITVMDHLDDLEAVSLLTYLLKFDDNALFSREILEAEFDGPIEPFWTTLVKKRFVVGFTFFNKYQETYYMVSDKPIEEDTYIAYRDETISLASVLFDDNVMPFVKPIEHLAF